MLFLIVAKNTAFNKIEDNSLNRNIIILLAKKVYVLYSNVFAVQGHS